MSELPEYSGASGMARLGPVATAAENIGDSPGNPTIAMLKASYGPYMRSNVEEATQRLSSEDLDTCRQGHILRTLYAWSSVTTPYFEKFDFLYPTCYKNNNEGNTDYVDWSPFGGLWSTTSTG